MKKSELLNKIATLMGGTCGRGAFLRYFWVGDNNNYEYLIKPSAAVS
jgi:hypothetical protein